MDQLNQLPIGFSPYKELNVCSNKLLGGAQLFLAGHQIPLVIGSGSVPQVWLKIPVNLEKGKLHFYSLIEGSVSAHSAAVVKLELGILTVNIDGKPVLTIETVDEETANVSQLDLRSIGYPIYGSSTELIAGNKQLIENTINGGVLVDG